MTNLWTRSRRLIRTSSILPSSVWRHSISKLSCQESRQNEKSRAFRAKTDTRLKTAASSGNATTNWMKMKKGSIVESTGQTSVRKSQKPELTSPSSIRRKRRATRRKGSSSASTNLSNRMDSKICYKASSTRQKNRWLSLKLERADTKALSMDNEPIREMQNAKEVQ